MKRVLSMVLLFLILLTGCSESASITVETEIDCSDILSNYEMLSENLKDEEYVPSSGIILEKTEISVPEGSNAIDVLKAVAKEINIQTDISDGYAKGINYIYEKSAGAMSGWIYEVNNQPVMSEYTVSEGDLITWKYICDFSSYFE